MVTRAEVHVYHGTYRKEGKYHPAKWTALIGLEPYVILNSTPPHTVLGHKFKSQERFRAKGALWYTIYLL
jgi:hypothetical protein